MFSFAKVIIVYLSFGTLYDKAVISDYRVAALLIIIRNT